MPTSLKDGDYHLVKRFSKRGGKYEVGLINDINYDENPLLNEGGL